MSPAAAQPVIERVVRKLGGRKALGRTVGSEADLARVVDHGMRLGVLDHVRKAGFSRAEIERLIIPARTLRHREARHESLSTEESDRLVRLTRIQAMAEDVFGDVENANTWLRQPLGILDGKCPLDVARTDAGARLIEQFLGKLDWGAAA